MEIERLNSDAWRRLKELRVRSLADAPDAFATTLADVKQLPEEAWRQQLETLATFVAVDERVDLGIARGVTDHSIADQAFLVSMWVAPEARGKRAGERLIQAVAGWARDTGHTRLVLDVADANISAIALYERMGFIRTGETGALPPPREHILEHRRALDLGH